MPVIPLFLFYLYLALFMLGLGTTDIIFIIIGALGSLLIITYYILILELWHKEILIKITKIFYTLDNILMYSLAIYIVYLIIKIVIG